MTATELQRIALRLSNQCHCRYWLNFFSARADVKMAIQCLEPLAHPSGQFQPCHVHTILELGFTLYDQDDAGTAGSMTNCIYLINRTNEDGTPFESKIF